MSASPHENLSRRERQIMEFLYKQRSATVAEIRAGISDPPGYSAVRTIANILERKGHLSHSQKGKSYLYSPVTPRRQALQRAVQHLLSTYFDNSVEKAVTAMVAIQGKDLSEADIESLEKAIRKQRKKEAPS
jgi:BlaI family penicillinase repressor